MAKYKFIVFLIALFFSLNSYSQVIKNVRISQEGKTVVVLYDLTGRPGNYNVSLFYTLDDGLIWHGPLKYVTGDVAAQLAGKDKKIVWNAAIEKGQIEGTILFKLNAGSVILSNQAPDEPNVKPTYSPEYYKYEKSKTIWISGVLVSGGVGVFSMWQAKNYYNQYQTANTDAADLHKKVELYDKITPIAFGVAGICAIEFIIKAGKQGKAKKQPLSFFPQPVNQGIGLGFICKF